MSAVHGLLILSGFAGLGYQVLWTRMLSVGLGHEALSALAVVAAFFAGLAVGALVFDRAIARSRRPGAWYAGLELLIGLWSLALAALAPLANGWLLAAMGLEPSPLWRWTVAFGGPLLLLGPATVAMGATLPAAERVFARAVRDGRGLGGLYAANTLGAMAGALLTAIWLAPALGHRGALVAFAAVNLLCAALMLLGPARGESARDPLPVAAAGRGATPGGLAALFASGLLGVGFEVATIRALAQAMHNTVYSFAAAVAVYLGGAALGAALWQRFAARRGGADAGVLAALTAAACASGALAALAGPALRDALAGGPFAGLAGEALLALMVFGPASAAMGALFSALAQAMRGPDGGLGAAFAANTLGAALAPALVGLLLVPALGAVGALAALALGYAGLAAALAPRARTAAAVVPALGLAGLALLGPFDRRLVTLPPGASVVVHLDGPSASATVTRDASGARWLVVDGAFVMGGEATVRLDRAQGHLALMQHPDPRRALFLGVGAGATVAAAASHPGVTVEAVDILPQVLVLLPQFPGVAADLDAAGERIALRAADARRWVAATPARYDVILSDTFHPARDGAAMLYTVEHFAAIRDRLTDDGVFTQWLPLHQLDLPTFRLIARSFLAVFPDARLSMGNYNVATPLLALVGGRAGGPPDPAALLGARLDGPLAGALAAVGLDGPFALFGGFIAGPDALRAFVGEGPLNTDDRPAALYAAPRTVYAPLAPAVERLMALTDALPRRAADAVALPPTPQAAAFAGRLEAYWRARDAFIAFGAAAAAGGVTGDPARDADRLAPGLLAVVRLSPDFDAAYDPLLRMAGALAPRDPQRAERLLRDLAAANPARPEAAAALARLGRG